MDPSSLGIWAHIAKSTQLRLSGPYFKAHDAFHKNAHKFQKISYNGIIPFVYVGKEEIHKYM